MDRARPVTVRRSREPALWLLFSAGGTLAALGLPAVVFVLWVGPAVGWVAVPPHGTLSALLGGAGVRLVLFVVIALALYHWAHRFRYTLYDGLQLYHLHQLIATLTYGVATLLTVASAMVLFL